MRTAGLLTVSQHALGKGGCLPGGCRPGGCVCPGEVCLPGGCLPMGISQHAMGQTPPPWTDRHLWKHHLRKLRLREVKSISRFIPTGNMPRARNNCYQGFSDGLSKGFRKTSEGSLLGVGDQETRDLCCHFQRPSVSWLFFSGWRLPHPPAPASHSSPHLILMRRQEDQG